MRNLRTAIAGVAVCLVPSAVCYRGVYRRENPKAEGGEVYYRGNLKGKDGKRSLAERQSPFVTNFFGHREDEAPITEVFFEDDEKEAEWEGRTQTWRASPRVNRHHNGNGGKATKWSWNDKPCVPASTSSSSKSSKKSRAPTTIPSSEPTASSSVPSSLPSQVPSLTPTTESNPPTTTSFKSKSSSKKKSPKKKNVCPEPEVPGYPTDPDYPLVPGQPVPSPVAPPPGGSTPFPTLGKGSSADVPESSNCAAIEAQDSYTLAADVSTSVYYATLEIQSTVPLLQEGVLAYLSSDEFLPVIALWVGGCEARAQELAQEILDTRRRRLLEGTIDHVALLFSLLDESQENTCDGTADGDSCTNEFKGLFTVYHFIADGEVDDILKKRIAAAFANFSNLLKFLAEQDGAEIGEISVKKVETDGEFDSVITGPPPAEETLNVATVIGATAGGLAFILLIVLLAARRNQGEDEVSHLKLEEDEGEGTFIREFETTASSPSRDEGYEARNVHVVGEADSIFSGWTGYTARDKSAEDMDMYDQGDVHKCSSATCEVCEQRRQQGIQFIPTGSPVRPQLPSDSSRDYIADDTVEL